MGINLVLTHSPWVNGKYETFYEKHGYIPQYFDVYNALEIIDIAPTISTRSFRPMYVSKKLNANIDAYLSTCEKVFRFD